MRYNPDIHHRRSIRLPTYDYSSVGYYFIRICTHAREIVLNQPEVAAAVHNAWLDLPRRFPSLELDEFVVMPNHIHGILILREGGGPTLGRALRAFKSISAIAANRVLGRSERPFWQRNYHERVIRREAELAAVREYVRNNPLGWDVDPENPNAVASAGRR